MALNLGNIALNGLRLGASEVQKAYLGAIEVFSAVISYVMDQLKGDWTSPITETTTEATDKTGNGHGLINRSGRWISTDGVNDKGINADLSSYAWAGGVTGSYRITGRVRPEAGVTSVLITLGPSVGVTTTVAQLTGLTPEVWNTFDVSDDCYDFEFVDRIELGYDYNTNSYQAAKWSDVEILDGNDNDELVESWLCGSYSDNTSDGLNGLTEFGRVRGLNGTHIGCSGGTGEEDITQTSGMDWNRAPDMVLNVQTDNAGSSNDDQVTIPWLNEGTFNCLVDWGDGTTDEITTFDDTAWTHTFAGGAGLYTVTIKGTVGRLYFNNKGDEDKIVGAADGGALGFGITTINNAYYGCPITSYSHDILQYSSLTSCAFAWRDTNLTSWTVSLPSGLTSCNAAWFNTNLTAWTADLPNSLKDCGGAWLNTNLTSWTVSLPSSLTNCSGAWRDTNLTSWTGVIPPDSLCTNYNRSWEGCALDETSVNFILTQIDAAGTSNGTIGIDGGTNAAPTGAGHTAKANLEARGWTVNTN